MKASKAQILEFDGYWPVESAHAASYPGIYCIYAVSWEKPHASSRLLYVGESNNVAERINRQKKDLEKIAKECDLYFNVCPMIDKSERMKAKAALIYHHQPPRNIEFRTSFPYPPRRVTTVGKNANLAPGFIARE